MVKIKWTKHALEELDDIANYISIDSPKYAQIVVKQIYEMVSHLKQFPKLGRKVPNFASTFFFTIFYLYKPNKS